jgi:hypothetical protein
MAIKQYFEWDYFHFLGLDGTRINLVVHKTDIFGLVKTPYMTIIVKNPENDLYREKSLPSYNWVIKPEFKNGNFRFNFNNKCKFFGNIFDLELNDELRNIDLFTTGKSSSNWSVMEPFGKFDGYLEIEGSKKEYSGHIYHDKQWGNLPIQHWVRDWIWGNYVTHNKFWIFFIIQTQNGQLISHGMTNIEKLVVDNNFHSSNFEELVNISNPESVSFSTRITKNENSMGLRINLNPRDLMRARINENYTEFSASYFRWAADGLLEPQNGAMIGITEYLRIRKCQN